MRISAVNTTDVVCDKYAITYRIIQLGPTKGGTLWTHSSLWSAKPKSKYIPTTRKDQRAYSYTNRQQDVGHLAIKGGYLDDADLLAELTIPDFSSIDKDDYVDTAERVSSLLAALNNDDGEPGFELCVVDTRSLMSIAEFRAKEAAEKKRIEDDRRRRHDQTIAYQELFDKVAPMLAEAGVPAYRLESERKWNSTMSSAANADIRVPLKALIAIADKLNGKETA